MMLVRDRYMEGACGEIVWVGTPLLSGWTRSCVGNGRFGQFQEGR